jgi:hypothetical protein
MIALLLFRTFVSMSPTYIKSLPRHKIQYFKTIHWMSLVLLAAITSALLLSTYRWKKKHGVDMNRKKASSCTDLSAQRFTKNFLRSWWPWFRHAGRWQYFKQAVLCLQKPKHHLRLKLFMKHRKILLTLCSKQKPTDNVLNDYHTHTHKLNSC